MIPLSWYSSVIVSKAWAALINVCKRHKASLPWARRPIHSMRSPLFPPTRLWIYPQETKGSVIINCMALKRETPSAYCCVQFKAAAEWHHLVMSGSDGGTGPPGALWLVTSCGTLEDNRYKIWTLSQGRQNCAHNSAASLGRPELSWLTWQQSYRWVLEDCKSAFSFW